MSLKQIIIVDEDSKVTVRTSSVDYGIETVEGGKRCIEIGTRKPLDSVLRRFVEEEWAKIKEFGARLVTRKSGPNGGTKMKWFKKSTLAGNTSGATPVSTEALSIADHLSERSIHFFSRRADKEEILATLVHSLPVSDMAGAFHGIIEREEKGGTVIGPSISIPHARVKGLEKIELAVGICSGPAWPADQPRLFFLFLSPKEDTKVHLLFLSSLSALFQKEGFAEELLDLKAPHEIVQKIRQLEKGI